MTWQAHHVEFQPAAWAGFEADYDGDYGGAVEGFAVWGTPMSAPALVLGM